MIRVLVCDDQWIVCEGLEAILNADPDIDVVGIAHDGAQALDLIPELQPDVVLMDLKMPGMNGVRATHHITQNFPHVKVLVLTTYGADDWVLDAIRSGAAGYLLKGTPETPSSPPSRAPPPARPTSTPPSPANSSTRSPAPPPRPPARPSSTPSASANWTFSASSRAGSPTPRSPNASSSPKEPSATTSAPSSPNSKSPTAPRPPFSPSATA